MNDPFKIIEPTVISFSGGRTSGYMLWRILQSNNGLPDDAIVCFDNSGNLVAFGTLLPATQSGHPLERAQ